MSRSLEFNAVTNVFFYKAINDQGPIALLANLADDTTGVFRADPVVPEPTSLALLLTGAASLAVSRSHRGWFVWHCPGGLVSPGIRTRRDSFPTS
jgi:hypothetical protein